MILEFLNLLAFMLNGPAKSVPQCKKGREAVIRSLGKLPINCCIVMGLARKQTIHFLKMDFILALPAMGQYFCRMIDKRGNGPACKFL